ncbi:hypothetical protein NW762_008836 [Fusarium torreyae]|uniref:Uncharacterized protein n=1 Tax=Fusarium torreyae TaxID=1237075 RepID=A0A9W8VF34_9HYPO|nr:hypothetical protein NW762_008836 [Fusarium torreyae]
MDRRFDAQLEYVLNLVRDTVAPDAIPMANAIQDLKRLTKSMQKAKDQDYAEWLHEEKRLLDLKFAQLGSIDSHAERIYKETEALRKDLERVVANTRQEHTPKDRDGHTQLVAAITTLLTSLGDFAKGKQLDEMSRKLDDNTKRMETVLAQVEAVQKHDDLYQQNKRLEALVTQLQTEVSKLQAEADSDERAEFKDVCHQMIEENQALCERRERLDNLEQRESDIASAIDGFEEREQNIAFRERDLQEREKTLNECRQNTPDSRRRRREDSPKPAQRRNKKTNRRDGTPLRQGEMPPKRPAPTKQRGYPAPKRPVQVDSMKKAQKDAAHSCSRNDQISDEEQIEMPDEGQSQDEHEWSHRQKGLSGTETKEPKPTKRQMVLFRHIERNWDEAVQREKARLESELPIITKAMYEASDKPGCPSPTYDVTWYQQDEELLVQRYWTATPLESGISDLVSGNTALNELFRLSLRIFGVDPITLFTMGTDDFEFGSDTTSTITINDISTNNSSRYFGNVTHFHPNRQNFSLPFPNTQSPGWEQFQHETTSSFHLISPPLSRGSIIYPVQD